MSEPKPIYAQCVNPECRAIVRERGLNAVCDAGHAQGEPVSLASLDSIGGDFIDSIAQFLKRRKRP
jgi:hypothetical protein